MKIVILTYIVITCFAPALWADNTADLSLTPNEKTEIGQKLEAYENGKLTLDDLTTNADLAQKVMAYYLSHTNDVTSKMKLPISRCFAGARRYSDAARLATEYVDIYSNDWRGWRIVGGSDFEIGSFNAAIGAYTNAVRLGDDGSYATLGLAALRMERLDIFRTIIPRLFILKQSKRTGEVNPLDMVMLLAGYSLRVNQQDLFIKALDGVDAKRILSRDDLKQLVETGCERFKGKEIDKIRAEMEAVLGNNSSSSNTNSSSP
jgi:hypothetical protein